MHYYYVLPIPPLFKIKSKNNTATVKKKIKEIKCFFLLLILFVSFSNFCFRWKRNKSNHSHGESSTVGFSAMDETLIKRTYFV